MHLLKQAEVFLNRTIAIGRVNTRFGRRALLCSNLFCRLLINVSLTCFDHADSQFVELLEVVRSIENLAPFEAQPLDIVGDAIYILGILFHRIGIVKAEVANAIVLLSDAEIHTDGLNVTNVEVAIRFGRKTRLYSAVIYTFLQVFFYDFFNEIHTRKFLIYTKK